MPNRTVRSFLLQNLHRDDDGAWSWRPNLEVLGRDLDALGGWPADALEGLAPYDGPTLWLAGATAIATIADLLTPPRKRATKKAR